LDPVVVEDTVSVLHQLLESNRAFAASFDKGGLAAPPARKVAVLTCMDARIDPARMLGLEPGDAHVIRNAGGRASDDAIRSLIISSALLGTREFLVIHHTDCGMLTFSNDDLRARLADERGSDASGIDFLVFDDAERALRDDVERIRSTPHLDPAIEVSGYIYDVASGVLSEVVAATTASESRR
jgi:carbonic anhydrase